MEGIVKGVLLGLLVLYVISPVDLVPGPIDDAILAMIYIAGNIGRARNKKLTATNQPVDID